MTLEDIPEKLRLPGLIIFNGQTTHVKLTEKQGDELAFIALNEKNESA